MDITDLIKRAKVSVPLEENWDDDKTLWKQSDLNLFRGFQSFLKKKQLQDIRCRKSLISQSENVCAMENNHNP